MADRFFPNEMPDFVEENEEYTVATGYERDSLVKLLSMPYSAVSERLKRAGLDLKETVVVETWGLTGGRVRNFTLYSGTLGTAFLLFKSYQVTNNKDDLNLCSEIVKACDSASSHSRDVTFLCGRGGVCALGAVAANHLGNYELLSYYLARFKEIKLPKDLPDELLYGRAGFIWACLFLNKHIGEGTVPSTYIVFGDKEFQDAAINAAEVVWKRGLLKRVGICHGVSGNTYVFLSLYRLTGNKGFLYRAKAFGSFLLDRAHKLISEGEMHGGDNSFSLFEGIGGMADLFLDMTSPTDARFPGYEL